MLLKEALLIVAKPGEGQTYRLSLCCSFEPLHFCTFLKAHVGLRLSRKLGAIGRSAEVLTGLFGDLSGNIQRAVSDSEPIPLVVVVDWADLDPRLGLREGYLVASNMDASIVSEASARLARLEQLLAEGLVKILSRYFRFRFRRSRFTSIEINRALAVCVERINDQTHRRFGVSRRERFEKIEKAALKALPSVEYDGGEWKTAKLHPDCYVAVDGDYYSAPHIHRGKRLRIKLTEHHVEIFLNLERLAIHPRCRLKVGQRIKILAHFPANSVAFYEATPQKLLSQSRFIHPDLNALFLELFNADVYAHIRRAMGLVSACTKEISRSGHTLANEHIGAAIATMRRYNRIRTPYFQELLKQARKQSMNPQPTREIVRRPGNPFLRYVGGAALQATDEPSIPPTATQEKLPL